MIKTHIAASGMHAGEYVPCRAKYVPCRIAGKNEHVYFADEESMQEFNGFNDEVQRNIWQEESDNTDNSHTMMSTLQSGSTVDKDEYESVLNDIKNSNDHTWGAGHGMIARTGEPDRNGVILDDGWNMTDNHHTSAVNEAGNDDSEYTTYGNGETIMRVEDSVGYDIMNGEYDDRNIKVKYQDIPGSTIDYFYEKDGSSSFPVVDTKVMNDNHEHFSHIVNTVNDADKKHNINVDINGGDSFILSDDKGYYRHYSYSEFVKEYPQLKEHLDSIKGINV